jgi:hypothetical protein
MVDGAGGFDEFFGPGDRLVILDQITEPSRVCGDGGGVIEVAMVGSRVRPLSAGVAGDGEARLRDRQFTRSAGCSALAGVRIRSERSESRSSRFTLQFRWRDPRRRSRSGTHDRRSGLTPTGWCDGRTALTTSTYVGCAKGRSFSVRPPPQHSSGVRWEVSCSRELLSARHLHRRLGCVDGSFRPVPPAWPLAASVRAGAGVGIAPRFVTGGCPATPVTGYRLPIASSSAYMLTASPRSSYDRRGHPQRAV